ncbi:MAG: metallophosphoesterase [Anaeromyxobacter sp.]
MSRAALALAALALAAPLGCCACGSPTFAVRRGAALDPTPAPQVAEPRLRVLHLGDFGDPTCQQAQVAEGLAAAHRRARFELAFFAGDNIYECGPDPAVAGAEGCRFAPDDNTVAPGFTPPDDPLFARHEAALAPLRGLPIYLALGNHDVWSCRDSDPGGDLARRQACLEVAHASPAWSMPARHYVVDRGPARFIVVDTNLVAHDGYGGFRLDDEVAFVAEAARGCGQGRTCFLVGHHPPATAGDHRDQVGTAAYQAAMDRLLAAGAGRVAAFLAGHDHDLQHLRMAGGLDVLISGNGSRGRPLERFGEVAGAGATQLYGSTQWGHGVIEVGASGWSYRFESPAGAPLYCCAAAGAGRCEPTACK